MKKIFYILPMAALMLTASCSDEAEVFEVKPTGGVTFSPRPGGAVMKYTLPVNTDIKDIKVRYNDVNGKEVTLLGSYLSDSLALNGFNEARQNIPVYISYVNHQGVASEEYATTFSTSDSGPYAFFKTAEIKDAWDGFQLSYELPEDGMSGYAHIFRVGTNPNTGKQDTLLLSTITIRKGSDTQFFNVSDSETNTIVIKTEDFRGYFVKSQVWENVKSYPVKKVDSKELKVECPLSVEDESEGIGLQYLTDGDTKGQKALSDYKIGWRCFTFLMGPEAVGEPIIIDLSKQDVIASVRIYAQLKVVDSYPRPWDYNYTDTLPCEVIIWGSNDKKSWTELGKYSEPDDETGPVWYNKNGNVRGWQVLSQEAFDAAKPNYMDITIPVSDNAYRYLKVVPTKVFDTSYQSYKNHYKYVSMNELEVYVKK